MRVWLPAAILLPLALTGCPALLSDWSITAGSAAVDASVDGTGRDAAGGGSSSGSGGGGASSGSSGGSSSGGASGALGSSGGLSASGGLLGSGGSSSGGTTGSGGTTSTGGTTGSSPPSCAGLAATCGPSSNEDCCTSPLVTGGTFYRSYDGVTSGYTSQAYPATVSDFRLDKYEITVGRFRKFVAAYSQNMIAAGAGKNPNNASDPGWDTTWNASLAASAATLTPFAACGSEQTWTPSAGPNENKPINCIDWYEANAFCIWDGGRLPTEAEWNYAAAGGSEQRVHPWSSPANSTLIDCTYAHYYNGTAYCGVPPNGGANNVGSESPKGNGKYGQADLAGNVREWNFDWYASPYPKVSCIDCASTAAAPTDRVMVIRGGSSSSNAPALLSSNRDNYVVYLQYPDLGSRCARSAP